MPESLQQISVQRTKQSLDQLISAAESTESERLNWKPLGCGRSVMEQLIECVECNLNVTHFIRNRSFSEMPSDMSQSEGIPDLETAVTRLRETADALYSAILSLKDEEIDIEHETEWGTQTFRDGCFHCNWHNVYHEGQINYIQTLYENSK